MEGTSPKHKDVWRHLEQYYDAGIVSKCPFDPVMCSQEELMDYVAMEKHLKIVHNLTFLGRYKPEDFRTIVPNKKRKGCTDHFLKDTAPSLQRTVIEGGHGASAA